MLSWNKFRQGWVNYISVYFTTSAFQIIKASQLKLNINSDVKKGWLLEAAPFSNGLFQSLMLIAVNLSVMSFVDWQPKHAVANSQWPVLLRSLKGCCMMIILIWFPSQEISEDNIFLLSSTIIVVIGTFGVVVLCVFCVFLLAGFSSWCVPPNSFCLIRCEQKRWRIGEPSMRWVFLWKGLKCLSDTKFQIH